MKPTNIYKVVWIEDMGYYADKNTKVYNSAKEAFEKAYYEAKTGGNLGCYIYPIASDGAKMARIVVQLDIFNDNKIEVIIHV